MKRKRSDYEYSITYFSTLDKDALTYLCSFLNLRDIIKIGCISKCHNVQNIVAKELMKLEFFRRYFGTSKHVYWNTIADHIKSGWICWQCLASTTKVNKLTKKTISIRYQPNARIRFCQKCAKKHWHCAEKMTGDTKIILKNIKNILPLKPEWKPFILCYDGKTWIHKRIDRNPYQLANEIALLCKNFMMQTEIIEFPNGNNNLAY